MKLTDAEIERQAKDRRHLEPNPVKSIAGGWVCTACGSVHMLSGYDQHDLADCDAWHHRHRRGACQHQAKGPAKASTGPRTGLESHGDVRRVLGAKDSKHGGTP